MLSRTPPETPDSRSPLALTLGIALSEDRDEFMLEARDASLDAEGLVVDRGAIVTLIDHASGSHLRRLFDPSPLATLNLRIDWLAKPARGNAIRARPRLIAHHGMTALVAIDVVQSGADAQVAMAVSQMIVGVAPGGTDTLFADRPEMFEAYRNGEGFESFDAVLGMRCDGETICLPMADHLVGNATVSALHGGVIAAALDRAAAQTIKRRADQASWRPLDICIEYLRPAILGSDCLVLTSSTKRIGRTIASIEVVACGRQSGAVVARCSAKFVATGNQAILPAQPDRAAA